MKLTPKQKAFLRYLESLRELKKFRDEFQDWDCVGYLPYRHSARKGHHLSFEVKYMVEEHVRLIREAWKKRAACRAWAVEERYCCICAHGPMNLREKVCWTCIHHHHWEPRKEGE